MEEKDFKKEFEEFARKIKEENNPIFNGTDLEFDDLDNMLNLKDDFDDFLEIDSFDFEDNVNNDYPTIDLETEDIKMTLTLKKDYSDIFDLKNRKKEFINDLKDFIKEFESTEESNELMKFYDL
ncbi:MAG: hypothetical protein MJ224_07575 [archaeon]|nr:hypothetical protein [archaeon]